MASKLTDVSRPEKIRELWTRSRTRSMAIWPARSASLLANARLPLGLPAARPLQIKVRATLVAGEPSASEPLAGKLTIVSKPEKKDVDKNDARRPQLRDTKPFLACSRSELACR